MTEEQGFITMEKGWMAKTCPVCKSEHAIAHGWVFKDPPPDSPHTDTRKAIGEVFMHDGKEDCVISAAIVHGEGIPLITPSSQNKTCHLQNSGESW